MKTSSRALASFPIVCFCAFKAAMIAADRGSNISYETFTSVLQTSDLLLKILFLSGLVLLLLSGRRKHMTSNLPMKAYVRQGNLIANLAFTNQASRPLFDAEGEDKSSVLVKVVSASINPFDYKAPKLIAGKVVGLDFCGTVTQVGKDASSKFKIGDLVYGCNLGTLAEFISVPTTQIAKAPMNWKPHELGCIAVAYVSPLTALKAGEVLDSNYKKVEGKDSMLVIGASGGTGIASLQLAKALGFKRIAAICSSKNASFVKENGATEVVDYTNEREMIQFFGENFGTFDMVLDCATNSGHGEDYWNRSVQLLKRNKDDTFSGNYVALNGPPMKFLRYFLGSQKPNEKLIIATVENTSKDLEHIVDMLNATGARPHTHRFIFDPVGVESGFELLKSRRTKGKIVFDISG